MINYIKKVTNSIKIEEGETAIQNILVNIYFNERISVKELARKSLLPVPLVAAIKREFIKNALVIQDNGARLTEEGISFVEKKLGFSGIDKALYMRLMTNPWDKHKELEELRNELTPIFKHRPEVNVKIDQSKCTVDTALKRAIICLKYNSLIGKKILFVGDDDLTSIALALFLKKLFKDKANGNTIITILDIDNRVLEYISTLSKTLNLPIICEQADFKAPITGKYKASFDCFFTDPPYTIEGANLFLSRGIEAIKHQNALPIFLSYAHKSPEFDLSMLKNFVDMGLVVSEILAGFNVYEGANIIGNTGQMLVLKTTSKLTPSIEKHYEGKLYTGELRKTIRLYTCNNCGEKIKVGNTEKYDTIETLKSEGCSLCGGLVFNLISRKELEEVY